MTRLVALFALLGGCSLFAEKPPTPVVATPMDGHTRVAIPSQGVSIELEAHDESGLYHPGVIVDETSQAMKIGHFRGKPTRDSMLNGVMVAPVPATLKITLAELVTEVKKGCTRLAIESSEELPDGYRLLTSCTMVNTNTLRDFSVYSFQQLSMVGGRRFLCMSAANTQDAAKYARTWCPTLAELDSRALAARR